MLKMFKTKVFPKVRATIPAAKIFQLKTGWKLIKMG